MAELIETGLEPEFNISDLAWIEPMRGGTAIRLCFASRRHGQLVAQYTVVVAVRDWVKIRSEYEAQMAQLGISLGNTEAAHH